MKAKTVTGLLIILIFSCSKSENDILYNKDFNSGDWLLVNVNYARKTVLLIDDEVVLKNNIHGISISSKGKCDGTTCDGFIKLYKDGILVEQKEYLNNETISESEKIKAAYKLGEELFIEPNNKMEFEKKWDSLVKNNNYPTIHQLEPKNTDIIWNYREKYL